MPTRTAVAGVYQSKTGEDFIHYKDSSGNVVSHVANDGTHYMPDCANYSGVSLSGLHQMIQTIINVGLPAVIDCGTF